MNFVTYLIKLPDCILFLENINNIIHEIYFTYIFGVILFFRQGLEYKVRHLVK